MPGASLDSLAMTGLPWGEARLLMGERAHELVVTRPERPRRALEEALDRFRVVRVRESADGRPQVTLAPPIVPREAL